MLDAAVDKADVLQASGFQARSVVEDSVEVETLRRRMHSAEVYIGELKAERQRLQGMATFLAETLYT